MANNVTLDVRGIDKLIQTEPAKVEAWLAGVANEILSEIVLSFGTSSGGATYVSQGKSHTASKPGDPPNVDTGTLRASMNVQKEKALTYHVSDGVEYGIMLEDGTEHIAPRPFVRPVFDSWANKIEADAKKHLGLED